MRMDEAGDFFSEAVKAAQGVLSDVVLRGGLHLRPGYLSRGVARQCRVRLAFLMRYIRQLIFLLAAGMMQDLPPVKSRTAQPRRKPAEGVEDVTASFGPRPWRFALVPAPYAPLPAMTQIKGKLQAEEVPASGFLEKVVALSEILADPQTHARQMARTLLRWKAAGDMTPVSVEAVPGFRADRLTECLSQALSERLNTALAVAWNESG